jgi:hypothetical protein
MKHFSFILIYILCFLKFSDSQIISQPILPEAKKDSFLFKFSDINSEKGKITNYMIEELSKSIPKMLDYTQYSFTYNYQVTFFSNNKIPNWHAVSVEIKDGKCSGDIYYKKFNVSDVLLPEYADIIIDLKNTDGSVAASVPVASVKLMKGKGEKDNIRIENLQQVSQWNVAIQNKLFYYSDSGLTAFKNEVQYINDYYNTEFVISTALQKLQSINLDNVEMVKVYDFEVKDVEKIVDDLNNKLYPEKLHLDNNDPVDFKDKFLDLIQQTRKMRFMINNMLGTIDKVYYDKGMEYYKAGDISNALKFMGKSTEANPYYSEAFYQTAYIYYTQKDLENAAKNISIITTKLNPDPQILKLTLKLGNDIYKDFISIAEEFMLAEKYNEALEVLAKAKEFCTASPAINCNEILQKDIAKSKYGVYNSFVTVSQEALNKDILYLAEIYIVKAKNYQKDNSTDIISSAEADDLLNQLVKGFIRQGFLFNEQLKYDSALVVLQKARDFCKEYPAIKCNDKLEAAIVVAKKGQYKIFLRKAESVIHSNNPAEAEKIIADTKAFQQANKQEISDTHETDSLTALIQKQYYDKYIADGMSYLSANDAAKAIASFQSAKTLEKKYNLAADKRVDSLLVTAIKPLILNDLEKACVKVWGNEFDKARIIADTAKILQSQYSLMKDSIINKAFADFSTKLHSQQCRYAQDNYDEYYRDALININLMRYKEADDYLSKCLKTVNENDGCNIKDSLAKISKDKYFHAAEYQRMLAESGNLATASKYYNAIDKYIECDNYYNNHNVHSLGIVHTPLIDYLSSLTDNNYLYKCAYYYFDKGNYDNAFKFLEILRKKAYSENNTVDLQKALANKLATNDFSTNSKQKPSVLIKKYTNSEKWYNCFKKTYTAQWKELKKKK